MIKELWFLIKLLFHRTIDSEVEVLLLKHFPWNGYKYMMWCGKVITTKDKYLTPSETSLRHERIHLKQAQMYSHWYKYYLRYAWEWIKGNPFTHPAQSAYYTIPFEMEAYGNEHRPEYWLNYNRANLRGKYSIKERKATYRANRDRWKQFCKEL